MGLLTYAGAIVLLMYVVIIAIAIAIRVVIANQGVKIAELKGYYNVHAFAMCFWLGTIGFIYVAGLPDLNQRKQNAQIINLLAKQLEKSKASGGEETA